LRILPADDLTDRRGTPETLKDLTRVAKTLGPKGLMPNKKTGTVTTEIGKAVRAVPVPAEL
jgi:ribosomal protein L1